MHSFDTKFVNHIVKFHLASAGKWTNHVFKFKSDFYQKWQTEKFVHLDGIIHENK